MAGCHQAQLSLRLPATQAVRYVNQEIPLFFAHLVITEGLEWRWEGRITAVTIGGQRGSTHLNLSASGYWASIRDEEIRESITYTGLRADEIMCELLRTFSPSVVIRNCVDVVPGVLESFEVFPQRYTQDVIVNDLARLGDENLGRYYATIQEGREFHYRRVDNAFHKWRVRLDESDRWSLGRSVRDSRGTRLSDFNPIGDHHKPPLGHHVADADGCVRVARRGSREAEGGGPSEGGRVGAGEGFSRPVRADGPASSGADSAQPHRKSPGCHQRRGHHGAFVGAGGPRRGDRWSDQL